MCPEFIAKSIVKIPSTIVRRLLLNIDLDILQKDLFYT